MVRHIVFFKLKEEQKKENVKKLKDALEALKDKIECIVHLEVGVNFSEKPSAFDLSLIVDLKSRQDLEYYRIHPEHQKVVELILKINQQSAVVDYEC